MTTSTPEKQDGLKALGDAIEVIQNKITSLGGVFNVQMAVSFMDKYVHSFLCIILKRLYYFFAAILAKSRYCNGRSRIGTANGTSRTRECRGCW